VKGNPDHTRHETRDTGSQTKDKRGWRKSATNHHASSCWSRLKVGVSALFPVLFTATVSMAGCSSEITTATKLTAKTAIKDTHTPVSREVDLECGDCGQFSVNRSAREYSRIRKVVNATSITKFPGRKPEHKLECERLLDDLKKGQFSPISAVNVVSVGHPTIQKYQGCSAQEVKRSYWQGAIEFGNPKYKYELYDLGFDLVYGVQERNISTYPHVKVYTSFDVDQCKKSVAIGVYQDGTSERSEDRLLLLSTVVQQENRFYIWTVQEAQNRNLHTRENPLLTLKLTKANSAAKFEHICSWSSQSAIQF